MSVSELLSDKATSRDAYASKKSAKKRKRSSQHCILVNIRKVRDEVVVTQKAKAPVNKSEEKEKAWNNLLFCNN